MQSKNLIKGYIYVVLSALIFGLMPLMAKLIYAQGVNPPTLVFLRNIMSVPILFLISLLHTRTVRISIKVIPAVGFIALMGGFLTPLLLFCSYNYIPSGTATVFHFIYPAVVVMGEFVFLKTKIKYGHIISVIMCVVGIALFYNPNSQINFKGGFFALFSGITYSVYIICLSGFKSKEIPGFTISFYIAVICSVTMLLACIFTNQLDLPDSLLGWLLSLLFAVGLNVGAAVLFLKGTFLIGGGRASIISTFEPITSIIAGAIVFNEEINAFTIIGTLLVIAASVLIAFSDAKNTKN